MKIPMRLTNMVLVLVATVFIFCNCSKQSVERAGQGAATGAVVGAVGGMVSALVFGGNVGDAAARGAVWGASTGAAAGAMSGAMADSNQKKAAETQKAADLEKLKRELGDDAFNGLAALVECKHEIALAYGRTAAQADNPDFSLAGLWLQILAYADNRQEDQARALFTDLVAKDSKLSSDAQAETEMRGALQKLGDIREEYQLPRVCG